MIVGEFLRRALAKLLGAEKEVANHKESRADSMKYAYKWSAGQSRTNDYPAGTVVECHMVCAYKHLSTSGELQPDQVLAQMQKQCFDSGFGIGLFLSQQQLQVLG